MHATLLRSAEPIATHRWGARTRAWCATRADGSEVHLFIGPAGPGGSVAARGYVLSPRSVILDRLRFTRDRAEVVAWWRFHNAIAASAEAVDGHGPAQAPETPAGRAKAMTRHANAGAALFALATIAATIAGAFGGPVLH